MPKIIYPSNSIQIVNTKMCFNCRYYLSIKKTKHNKKQDKSINQLHLLLFIL